MPRAARRKPPPTRPDGIQLTVSVVHASLEHATWPLAVGHVQGMPLRGAEGVLDRRLGGRLSDRLLMGAYPDTEGQAIYVPAPESAPPGGLVLGLGSAGEVTINKVTRAMTAAVLQWALHEADAMAGIPDEPVPLGVSAALVGTNPLDGITLQDSLSALVDGVVSAEQLIRSSVRLRSLVRVATLEIVELYQERARTASTLLQQLDTATLASPAVTLEVAPEVEVREGGLPGAPPADYTNGGWWRIQVLGVDAATHPPAGYRDLEYTSLGRRATADRLVARIEADTIDGLVQSSITSPRPDPQLGNTLFELLVPHELKPGLLTGGTIQLVVDPGTAAYPWEALASDPPGGPEAGESRFALRYGVVRQFSERDAREARFTVRRPTGDDVLVIANPPAGDSVLGLPGAAAEGRRVTSILGKRRRDHPPYDVHSLIWDESGVEAEGLPPAESGLPFVHILNALYRHEYRIIHIAAHGSFVPDDPAHSGILIGPGQFLTATTINQMPVVPELVFLNCCYSGRVGTLGGMTGQGAGGLQAASVNRLAASVARSLLLIGVRAVVAAGWAVDDNDAEAFAAEFYGKLLDAGLTFGEAVTAARRAATRTNTWAAYQCYGDPGLRMRSPAGATDT